MGAIPDSLFRSAPMKLQFQIDTLSSSREASVDIDQLIIAGWAGRDLAAIEHHIEELAALGVPRPSAVPLYYRCGAALLSQAGTVQAVGEASSGEAEVFLFSVDGELHLGIASDHTDRALEAHSVALSKQACPKPVSRQAWRLADVAGHWDELLLRSWIVENGQTVLYQDGPLAALRTPADLLAGLGLDTTLPAGTAMLCGTVGALGGIRAAQTMVLELHDPVLQRSLQHRYHCEWLPVVA